MGAQLSRASAAHLLVGGANGLLGSTSDPMCVGGELSPAERTALLLLRESGVSLALVSDPSTSTEDLLNGSLGTPPYGGSVRQRLGELHQIIGFQGAAGERVAEHYGLTNKDFEAARNYLINEARAFARSTQAVLASDPHAPLGYRRSVATAEPHPLPEGAWSARARYSVYQEDWAVWALSPWGSVDPYIPLGMDGYIGTTHSEIRELMWNTSRNYASATGDAPTVNGSVLGLLGNIVSSGEYRGVVGLGETTGSRLYLSAYGYSPADRVRVVHGEDGLRCALEGNIEGAPCDLGPVNAAFPCGAEPNLTCLTVAKLASGGTRSPTDLGTYSYGTSSWVSASPILGADILTALRANKDRLYWVKPKTSTSPELPGNFELLVGGVLNNVMQTLPVVPSVDKRVSAVLAPNRKFCPVPETSCAGVTMDARLPLEDELTDDSNGIENSWRHYLTLARQAADEADLLGRQYQDTELAALGDARDIELRKEENYQRAEEALQQVQEACGTALDSRRLLQFLTTDPANSCRGSTQCTLTPFAGAACTAQGTCGDSRYACLGGRCVIDFRNLANAARAPDLANDPDMARLQRCLGAEPSDQARFVTLGSIPLCVGVSTANPNDVCPSEMAAQSLACPSDEVAGSCPAVSGALKMERAQPLDYFGTPPPPPDDACDLFRRLRHGVNTSAEANDLLTRLANSNMFHPAGMREDVGPIEYVAKYGGYVDLSVDGGVRITTGSVEQGPAGNWPCQARSNCEQKTGLYCSSADCTCSTANCANSGRGPMNERLFRAALAANLARGFEAPNWNRNNDAVLLSGMRATLPYLVPQDICGTPTLTAGPGPIDPNNISPVGWVDQTGGYYANGIDSTRDHQGVPVNGCKWGYYPSGRWRRGDMYADSLESPLLLHYFQHDAAQKIAWLRADRTAINGQTGITLVNPAGIHVVAPAISDVFFFYGLSTKHGIGSLVASAALGAVRDGPETPQPWLYRVLAGLVPKEPPPIEFSYTLPTIPRIPDATALISSGRLSGNDLLDGMELLCELRKLRSSDAWTPPLAITRAEDISAAGASIRYLADQLNQKAARMVFDGVPAIARDALRSTSPTGAFPTLGGKMAIQVSSLREALISTRHALPVISGAMTEIGGEMESLGARLKIRANDIKLVNLKEISDMLNHLTECAAAMTNVATQAASEGTNGLVICANAMAQIAIGAESAALQRDNIGLERQIDFANFRTRMSQISGSLSNASTSFLEAAERIDAAAAGIDALRKEAERNLAKAVYLASHESVQQATYTLALGTLATAEQRRYNAALRNAKLVTDLAKRAIEQRLGVRLSEMREPLALVDAPASWEGKICNMNGLNEAVDSLKRGDDVTKWQGGFIGDYVTQLENLVESYRLQNKFHDGSDLAVISLRDDVLNVRAPCPVASANLFARAAALSDAGYWQATGCTPVTIDQLQHPGTNCITPALLDDVAVRAEGIVSGGPGYSLVFGEEGTCSAGSCGWTANAALTQRLPLAAGKYRLSWYSKDPSPGPATAPGFARVRASAASGSLSVSSFKTVEYTLDNGAPNPWKRYSVVFSVDAQGMYEVGFGTTGAMPSAVSLAAPMLEHVGFDTSGEAPGPFQDPGYSGQVTVEACEDTDGSIFRFKHWRRECVHQCSTGFSNECTDGPEFCYREMSFALSQKRIQEGRVFNYSGFARGNFNYRIDTLGLNFVGNVRDCSDATLPNTCFNAAFVPYSIDHNGPLFVLNHAGAQQRAYLFDGRIEHARGLAAERYFTNPLSSTDQQLIEGYLRSEFRGRPLDGQFVIRVWEEPGVDFDAIKDVQLLLKYRYWTRFN
ncbi:MAG: hypothetical protein ACOY0T_09230 [Myxococcota bacterium]